MYPRNTKPTPSYFGCQSQPTPPAPPPSFAAQWLFGHWKDCGIVKIFPTRHREPRGGSTGTTGGGERGRVQLPPWRTHVTGRGMGTHGDLKKIHGNLTLNPMKMWPGIIFFAAQKILGENFYVPRRFSWFYRGRMVSKNQDSRVMFWVVPLPRMIVTTWTDSFAIGTLRRAQVMYLIETQRNPLQP